MKRFLLAGLLSLVAVPALAQPCSGPFAAGEVCGNSGTTTAPASKRSLTTMFDRAFCGTNNSIIARSGGTWSCTTTLPNAVQDNITRLGNVTTVAGFPGYASGDKVCFVSASALDDSNSGLLPFKAKLTLQACEDLIATAGTVHVSVGTYTQSASYTKRPGVLTYCEPGAIITRANATAIDVVDASTNSPTGAGFYGCILDGNRVNNTEGSGQVLHIGNAPNFSLLNTTVRNGTGTGVYITGVSPNVRIQDSNFSSFYANAIYCNGGSANTDSQLIIHRNTFQTPGFHMATIQNCDGALATDNKFIGKRIEISISGTGGTTAVTLTAGTTAGMQPGDALVYVTDGGLQAQEALIHAVPSSGSLTLLSNLVGTVTNKPAVVGTGDMLSVNTSSKVKVRGNQFSGGVTGGVVLFNGDGAAQLMENIDVSGNSFTTMGGSAIGGFALAGKIIRGLSLVNNPTYNVALNGTTIVPAAGLAGIYLEGVDLVNTWIDAHKIEDSQGTPTLSYGVYLNGIAAGGVLFGRNAFINPANPGIFSGITSTVLSAGWGAGATSTQQTYGTSFTVTATAGAGPGANPTITIVHKAVPSEAIGNYTCQLTGGTGFGTGAFVAPAASAGFVILTYVGTPVNGSTYKINCVS